ncbi:MAG: hypothetical protein JXN61_09375, partial [Sedimentisphaerales bacterium]|nr:hypothetical protein [Sedimentisphaerales bacterium]
DCLGGIVVCKPATGIPRLVIQDPNYPVGWGAIQVKDRYEIGVFTDVSAGDWISLTNMLVEENKGTTFLQYIEDNDPAFTIVSTGNPLPRPLTVSVGEIGAPAPGGWDGLEFTEWLVVDHSAEKYESMLIKVIDVNIGGRDYGKAYDNYVLQNNADPNSTCWASDYMNEDIDDIEGYHPYILTVPHFCSVAGLLEQYTGAKAGIDYDYYQLLTRSTADFVIEQTADFDGNCDVDFVDFGLFAQHWLETGCCEPDWCGGADFGGEGDGIVWMTDLAEFARYWLAGN